MSHALISPRSIRPRDILRWWPLLLAAMGVALISAAWAHQHTAPSYTATTKLVVVPLPQWDETFLGTDLVRDSGDATRTATTVATQLKSEHFAVAAARYLGGEWTPETVAAALNIAAPGQTNIIEIGARADDPGTANRLVSGFTAAMMADRWQTISAQVDARISALTGDALTSGGDQQGANPAAAEQASRLRTLAIVRDSKADPTLRVSATGPAVRKAQMSLPMTMVLAALGGLFVGALAAAALEWLRRSRHRLPVESNGAAPKPMRAAAERAFIERKHVDVTSR